MTKLLENDKYLQLILIAAAIVLGLGIIGLTGVGKIDFIDSEDYLLAAKQLLESGTYPDSINFPFFRPPLYPLMIVLLGGGTSFGSIVVIKVVQVILHALTGWLLFKTAYTITENRLLSFFGALIFVINPIFLYNAAAIQSEALHTFLVTLALFIFTGMIVGGTVEIKKAAFAGIALGLAALCKPSALGVGVVLAVMFFLLQYRVKGILTAAGASAVVVAAMFVTLLPWSFYTLKTRSEFFLVNDAGGFNLWLGNLPSWIPVFEGRLSSIEEADAYEKTIERQRFDQIAEWETAYGYSSLSLKEKEKLWQAKAIENMQNDPGSTARLLWLKLWVFWKPFTSPLAYSTGRVVLSAMVLLPLYIFGLLGLWQVNKTAKARKMAWLFLGLAAAVTVIHVVIISSMRLRLPYVDPLLSVFAGIGFGTLLLKLVARWEFLPPAIFMSGKQAAQ